MEELIDILKEMEQMSKDYGIIVMMTVLNNENEYIIRTCWDITKEVKFNSEPEDVSIVYEKFGKFKEHIFTSFFNVFTCDSESKEEDEFLSNLYSSGFSVISFGKSPTEVLERLNKK